MILTFILLLAANSTAMANGYSKYSGGYNKYPNTPLAAPELDAATAPLAVLLIAGLMAIRIERRRK